MISFYNTEFSGVRELTDKRAEGLVKYITEMFLRLAV